MAPPRPVPELVVAPDAGRLAEAAAERVAGIAAETVARAGRFTVALAGGATPKALYARLAAEPYRWRVPWHEIHVFWGDERCVGPEHPESNYRMAAEALLRRVPVPPGQIHRMRGEDPDPERAAADYERLLREVFQVAPGVPPRLDLVLLGLGADGHTASLFPGTPALRETTRLVAAVSAERLGVSRLTLTLPVLNAAAVILFLVSGEAKAEALRAVLEPTRPEPPLPARLVRPRDGTLTWLVDAAAARLLQRSRAGALP